MEQPSMEPWAQTSRMTTLIEPLYKVKGWIKFAGIVTIISGAAQVLSVWGIIIAWMPIWMGIVLLSASNLIEQAYTTENEQLMTQSLEKLGTYFKIMGIFVLAMLVIAVLGILAAIMIPTIMGLHGASMGM